MTPLFSDGDVIYFKKKKFDSIKVNDIICAKKKRRVFTHRVIYKTKKYLITRGDSNYFSDGKIYPRNVIGTVYKVKREGQIIDIEGFYLIQSTLYFGEILKVKKALERQKINHLFLKGLPLYLYFAGKQPSRVYRDCDILTHKNSLSKVARIMSRLGYKQIEEISVTGTKVRESPEISYYKFFKGFLIIFDIHAQASFLMSHLGNVDSLYPGNLVDRLTRKILNERVEINVNGENFAIPSKENLLIFLCLHLFKHHFKGTYRFDFIAQIIAGGVDYAKVEQTVSEFNLKNFVYPVFLILEKYYSLSFDRKFIESIRPGKSSLKQIQSYLRGLDIFRSDDPEKKGKHFELLFSLSPSPLWRKMTIFLNPKVLAAIVFVTIRSIKKN